jgi:hypothetical protein
MKSLKEIWADRHYSSVCKFKIIKEWKNIQQKSTKIAIKALKINSNNLTKKYFKLLKKIRNEQIIKIEKLK